MDISDQEKTDDAIGRAAGRFPRAPTMLRFLKTTNETVQVGMYISDSRDRSDNCGSRPSAQQRIMSGLVGLKFTPFPHQRDGITWAAGMIAASLDSGEAHAQVQGGLLADDMGLGKTFMTLVALRDFRTSRSAVLAKPSQLLAVLPLSLIETWEDELRDAFGNTLSTTWSFCSPRAIKTVQIQGRSTVTCSA